VWHFFPSLESYVDGLKEMADIVGVDHVSIGTDQFDARGCVEDYSRWVHLVAAMLRGGFTAEEAGKIAGGNYMRIFRTAVGRPPIGRPNEKRHRRLSLRFDETAIIARPADPWLSRGADVPRP